ncbi:hypothetical protein PR048_019868 [Dryococelus australis]|uniref:CCHC-type domain-containing protein n=1 Tax=Dryococelus australis TaxID=614101 RepID=A0ABQ9H4X0_9NEOP|nr:hypothetical protein PR048_019868 [Dryococelus australis]
MPIEGDISNQRRCAIVHCANCAGVGHVAVDSRQPKCSLNERKCFGCNEVGHVRCLCPLFSQAFVDLLLELKILSQGYVSLVPEKIVCVANGDIVRSCCIVCLQFKTGRFTWTMVFFISDRISYDVILGLEFLDKTHVVVNFDSNYLSLGFAPNIRGLHPEVVPVLNPVYSWDDPGQTEFQAMRNRHFKFSPSKLKTFCKIIEKLLVAGVSVPSMPDYCSPGFLVRTKDNDKYRLVVNHSLVNRKIHKDPFQLPTIGCTLQHLCKARVFSVLDLNNCFHQCLLDPLCRIYTTFSTLWNQYKFMRIPIGSNFGSQAHCSVLDHVLSEY